MLITIAALQVLNAVLVGGVAWYFAYHQKRIAQAKLRLDLFEKRFAVFDAARLFISKVIAKGTIDMADYQNFLVGTIDAEFLLHDEIETYFGEIRKRSAAAMAHRGSFEGEPVGPGRTAQVKKYYEEIQWLIAQTNELPKKFRPFLKLDG
jgi:hypothetical protein